MDGRNSHSLYGHHSKPLNHEPQPNHLHTISDNIDLDIMFEDSSTTLKNPKSPQKNLYIVSHPEVNAMHHLTRAYKIGQLPIAP
jgi:hypothetical protein